MLYPVAVGVLLGLVVGKPFGVALGAWLAVRAEGDELHLVMVKLSVIAASILAGIIGWVVLCGVPRVSDRKTRIAGEPAPPPQ